MSPVLVPTRTTTGPKVEKLEIKSPGSFYCVMLPLELFMGPPRLEGEKWTPKSPVTVPTGTTTSSQAGKEIKVWL
jgi:hypothetical protein